MLKHPQYDDNCQAYNFIPDHSPVLCIFMLMVQRLKYLFSTQHSPLGRPTWISNMACIKLNSALPTSIQRLEKKNHTGKKNQTHKCEVILKSSLYSMFYTYCISSILSNIFIFWNFSPLLLLAWIIKSDPHELGNWSSIKLSNNFKDTRKQEIRLRQRNF